MEAARLIAAALDTPVRDPKPLSFPLTLLRNRFVTRKFNPLSRSSVDILITPATRMGCGSPCHRSKASCKVAPFVSEKMAATLLVYHWQRSQPSRIPATIESLTRTYFWQAETIRRIMHLQQGRELIPGKEPSRRHNARKILNLIGWPCRRQETELALRCLSADNAIFDRSNGWQPGTHYHTMASSQSLRFLDCAMYYSEAPNGSTPDP